MGITASEFEAAYRAHGPTVLGIARRIMGDHHAGEDAAQNAWLQFWEGRHRHDSSYDVLPLMRKIVRQMCLVMRSPEKFRRKVRLPTTAIEDMPPAERERVEQSVEPLQEAHAEGERLRVAIDTLQVRTAGGWTKTRPASQEMRDTMHMLIKDIDVSEIALARGVEIRGVNSLIQKAILALRHKWSVKV